MNRRFRTLVVSSIALSASLAQAGGVSYEVRVVEFSRGTGTKATFTVEGATEDVMPACRQIQVTAEYAVRNLPWAKPLVTRGTHELALARLDSAHVSGRAVRFGTLGNGLRTVSRTPCRFRSNGLVILAEQAGTDAVYSVYK